MGDAEEVDGFGGRVLLNVGCEKRMLLKVGVRGGGVRGWCGGSVIADGLRGGCY